MKINYKIFSFITNFIIIILLLGCSQKNIDSINNPNELDDTNNKIDIYEKPIKLEYQFEKYVNTVFPILDENIKLTEVNRFELDNILQVLYTKADDSSIYCYLEIDNIKYDLGALSYSIQPGENTELYNLEKTLIDYKNTIYKVAEVEGAASLGYKYFIIDNNIPTLLYTLYYSNEINNNDEIISVSSFGIPSYTCIYKWSDNGIYFCDINSLLDSIYAAFYQDNMTIHIIKEPNYDNPEANKNEFFNLIGDELVPLN